MIQIEEDNIINDIVRYDWKMEKKQYTIKIVLLIGAYIIYGKKIMNAIYAV